ncbi:hypothetical protein ACT1UH_02965 [Mycoplasma sp. 332]|uniref:hypothetical protein n=1 Tax=Mycoplasma sp. 332 TaxID=3458236 RepID=UPI004036A981
MEKNNSDNKIRQINCNSQNYVTVSIDSLNKNHYRNKKLVVYKNFDIDFWNKNAKFCPYIYVKRNWWNIKKFDFACKENINLEIMRIHNEWVASTIAANIASKFFENYLIIYESTGESFFWSYLKNHCSLLVTRKVFKIKNDIEEKDFCVLSNIKRFSNFNKNWKSIEEFENAVLNLIEQKGEKNEKKY